MIEWYAHESESPYLPSCFPIRWTFRNCPPSHRFCCQNMLFQRPFSPQKNGNEGKVQQQKKARQRWDNDYAAGLGIFFRPLPNAVYIFFASIKAKDNLSGKQYQSVVVAGSIKVPFKTLSLVHLLKQSCHRKTLYTEKQVLLQFSKYPDFLGIEMDYQ